MEENRTEMWLDDQFPSHMSMKFKTHAKLNETISDWSRRMVLETVIIYKLLWRIHMTVGVGVGSSAFFHIFIKRKCRLFTHGAFGSLDRML